MSIGPSSGRRNVIFVVSSALRLLQCDLRRIFRSVARLSEPEIERLVAFVHDAATWERDQPFPPDLVARLRELIPRAEWVTYCELDWKLRRTRYIAQVGAAAATDETIYWQLHHEHAVCEHFARTGDGRAIRMSDLLSPAQWRSRELYNCFYRPFQYELDMRLPGEPRCTRTFLFHSSRRDFTERDRFVLNALRPHLARIHDRFSFRAPVAYLPLTARELEILHYVARGMTNFEIARLLWISSGTVRRHLENTFKKLHVHTRTAAVARLKRPLPPRPP